MLTPSVKLWLKKGRFSVLGAGRAQLLRAIKEYGSISKAATAMDMSYRHAWGILRQISRSIGKEIVKTTRGGRQGGGAKLTKHGEKMLQMYENNAREIEKVLKYGPKPSVAVDGIIVDGDSIVFIRRGKPPFKGELALPGGFVEYNETTEHAIIREMFEELGIKTRIKQLIGVYSNPDRDPRHHTISVVYELKPLSKKYKAGDDAAEIKKLPIKNFNKNFLDVFAFDHKKIIFEFLKEKKI